MRDGDSSKLIFSENRTSDFLTGEEKVSNCKGASSSFIDPRAHFSELGKKNYGMQYYRELLHLQTYAYAICM